MFQLVATDVKVTGSCPADRDGDWEGFARRESASVLFRLVFCILKVA